MNKAQREGAAWQCHAAPSLCTVEKARFCPRLFLVSGESRAGIYPRLSRAVRRAHERIRREERPPLLPLSRRKNRHGPQDILVPPPYSWAGFSAGRSVFYPPSFSGSGFLQNSSFTPIYSKNTPKARRSRLMSITAAPHAASREEGIPARVQISTAFFSTSLFLMWETSAAGAQKRKYSRFDAAGRVLVDLGEAGHIQNQQGAAADAEAAEHPGQQADEEMEKHHSSSTARIPP